MITPTISPHNSATKYQDEMIPFCAVVSTIKHEVPNVATYTLSIEDPSKRDGYQFLPGQFNMLYLPGIGEAAISISSDPANPLQLQHTIREAGNVTSAISRLKKGDRIGLRGPYGSPWPVEKAYGYDLILVAGGIGLAPLRPVIYHIIQHREKYGKVVILVGARTPADLLFAYDYDAWAVHNIEVIHTVDRAEASYDGNVGVVPMFFYSIRPDPSKTVLFTCGPEIMMRFVIYEALARRIPKERIFVSLERNMKCAVGFCGHCQYGPTFLCKEGPVLPFSKVEDFYNVEDF